MLGNIYEVSLRSPCRYCRIVLAGKFSGAPKGGVLLAGKIFITIDLDWKLLTFFGNFKPSWLKKTEDD